MFALTVHTPKLSFLSNHRFHPPQMPQKSPPPLSVSALILPPSSSPSLPPQKQQLYQPFRPPPSPLPPRYRNLDTSARLEILSNRLGSWFEYAPLIPSLVNEGFTSSTLEELTGIPSVEQNRLVVAAQVRDSLVQFADDEDTVSFFNSPGSSEILYEIRILNSPQRVAAARFIIAKGFDTGRAAEELARSIKDFPRRYGDRGWESFDGDSPGDCLAFMYYRQAQEHKSAASSTEMSRAALERALEVVETQMARQRVEKDLEGKAEDGGAGAGAREDVIVSVPVVRMALGEVADSSTVVLLPVCGGVDELEEAPWEVGMGGEFGVVRTERGWSRWVVLPGWAPVAGLRRGGVAVEFREARGVLPWRGKRRDTNEGILVVADRSRREVGSEDGVYLVSSTGGNGNAVGGGGFRVERGGRLKEMGVEVSLGTVVLVVRPPRDEVDDQLGDDEWE